MLAIFFFIFSSAVFAAQPECPKWTHELTPFKVQMQSAAINCRSECQTEEDCIVEQDTCGRRFAINRKYEAETKKDLASLNLSECPKKITLPLNEKVSCLKNKCQLKTESCASSSEVMKYYLDQNFSRSCSQDRDCSYLLQPTQKCVDYYPINAARKESINEYELNYLTSKVLKACSQEKGKFCSSKKVSQCFMNQCIQTEKQIPFISYVNLEGPKYTPNFKSRTVPLLLPTLNELRCQKKSDCVVSFGICGQYAVALEKNFSRSFQNAVQKKAASIACPVAVDVKLPKPECIENYCVFAEK